MIRLRALPMLYLAAAGLWGQAPPKPPGPSLEPGEGFAFAEVGGKVQSFGEGKKEAPMGSLAKLVWLRLEGVYWGSQLLTFKCTGAMDGYTCWNKQGHGRVDVPKATQESCNLAYLAWARLSAQDWKATYGEGAARTRLEGAFAPFLGNRMPAGDGLPAFTPAWVGDGDLLRTTPEAFATWMLDPMNEELLDIARRNLLPFWKTEGWWFKTGTAPVPGEPGATSAWAAGSDGHHVAVLHLPRGKGKAEGLARMKAILGLPPK